jgi:predicted nucleic acid-binding Zn finger protein
MQQLTIEHKNTTTDQKVVEKTKKDRRPGKGRAMALSRRIYRLQNTNNTFYVESETRDDQYYFAKFKQDVLESSWYCSCKDNSTRYIKCKHLFAIEFALQWGTVKDIDKVPPPAAITADIKWEDTEIAQKSKSYKDDDYTF